MVLTRRAYRQSMEISRWLPNEVLVHIIQHSPKADQASLSRVSRLFHDLCLPVLYRVVKIKDSRAVTSFCSSVLENPSRADIVRSFAADWPYSYSQRPRSDLLLTSLKPMLRLNHLSLCASALDNRHSLILFEECNFPQLISCDIWAPLGSSGDGLSKGQMSDSIVLFLTRHPTLKRVHIHSILKMVASPSIRVSLPNIESYEGDAGLILAIDANALKSVQLIWFNDVDTEGSTEKIILRVSSMIKSNVPLVISHKYMGDHRGSRIVSRIVTSMSEHMRHPRTLRLQSLRQTVGLNEDTWAHHGMPSTLHGSSLSFPGMDGRHSSGVRSRQCGSNCDRSLGRSLSDLGGVWLVLPWLEKGQWSMGGVSYQRILGSCGSLHSRAR
ncbi:hypothetical protein C8R45DRAFT_965816 [Mycena sanguinolenta]|nr:hypothetical protein C8R45DRAFT_965816 [Mycena sanguinolenta]